MRAAAATTVASFLAFASLTAQPGTNDARARAIFKELIEINTTDSIGSTTKAADAMAVRLKAAGFPAADVQVLGPDPRKGNLVLRWRGTSSTAVRKPLLLLAHLDVVEAKREDWSFDPFVFLEKDGFFYGRGTSDDKGMASQFVANLIRLKEEGYTPDRDLILALTADEEGGNFNGVDWLVKNHRELIDAEFAINEGGNGNMRKGKYLTNEVQASEKVFQDFHLEVTNSGGHSSLPVKDNAIYHLSGGLTRLAKFDFPVQLNEVTRAYFERSAPAESDPTVAADMRAVARATPDPAAASRLSAAVPYWNSMMRTTCVATRLAGGHANNALPQLATANVNCRILPGVSPASVRDKLVEILADPQIKISFVGEATPSKPSPPRTDVMNAVESLTKDMFPGVVVVPVMSTGATDGLYLRNGEIPTYGIDGTFGDMDDVRAHGRDERVGVKQFFEGLEFQYRLIKALSSSSDTTRAPRAVAAPLAPPARARVDAAMQTVGRLNDGKAHDYGLGLTIGTYGGLKRVSHGGSWAGYRAELMRFPERHTSIITLCNVSNSGPTALAESVAAIWLADAGLKPPAPRAATPPPPAPPQLSDAELRAHAGRYSSPELTLPWNIELVDHQLKLRIRKGDGETLMPVSRDEFRWNGSRITFERDALTITNRGVERLRLSRVPSGAS
jgi:acetylornithine deacetylase/succinyl-diaminopimelate desuccinylase-like protein